jgi:maltooligosyltrehalose trehalohydrolase
VGPGDRYRYRLDGAGPFPDPASRSQPLGVHGPSQVVDPGAFRWSDGAWGGADLASLVIYELHVGTFTPEGTFAAAARHLPEVADLGATAVELLPVADFPGERNWGYDGVALFAPARCYGAPDDLRALVDRAHGVGLSVILDVVYNHLGPDGNYLRTFSRDCFARGGTPWGEGLDLGCDGARELVVENALHWIAEYHVDGLRLDSTHALRDRRPRHLLAELAERAHGAAGRRAILIAEDDRNLARIVRAEAEGGYGLDAVVADDFHHQLRRRLTGDRGGHYGDFAGSTGDLAETIRAGWLYRGQVAPSTGRPRGTDPSGIPRERFVFSLQNHDHVGNRALGDRLHHRLDPAAWRAALAVLLLSPETPLLFMGQEWAASAPFLFFTDHREDLGRRIAEGRRREFAAFDTFRDPASRALIPDPQDRATFERSRLDRAEREREPHAAVLRLHRALLRLRREEVLPRRGRLEARAAGPAGLLLGYGDLVAAVRLEGEGELDLSPLARSVERVLLTTEDPGLAPDPLPPAIGGGPALAFRRPGAAVLRVVPRGGPG